MLLTTVMLFISDSMYNRFLKKKSIVLFWVLFFISMNHHAIEKKILPENPKLVVMIVIDQFRPDYIYRYWEDFGEKGLKRLVTEGTVCRNAKYNYMFTQSAPGCATISTGTMPSVHGIVADSWFDRVKGEVQFCVADNNGNSIDGTYESGKFSPKWLLANTLSDELRFSNEGNSKTFGISLDPAGAILLSGHNANAAYWFDTKSGKWLTGSYYLNKLPEWVADFNNKKIPDLYIERQWQLENLPENKTSDNDTSALSKIKQSFKSFKHSLKDQYNKDKNFEVLKTTPFGNTLITDFSTNIIYNEKLGMDDFTDYLSIYYSATGEIGRKYGQLSPELRDAIIKLDGEIAQIITFLETSIGLENILLVVTADRGASYDPTILRQYKLPADYFNTYQATALLRSYLNVLYGKGNWVQYFEKNQIYLNRTLIEDSKIKVEDFQNVVSSFMVNFSGVANAVSASSLASFSCEKGFLNYFQNSYNPKRSGDVLLYLEPGWIEKNDDKTYSNSFYVHDTHVPLLWYGWKIKRQQISRPVNMTDVAPTLSNLLNIPNPNATMGNPINELVE